MRAAMAPPASNRRCKTGLSQSTRFERVLPPWRGHRRHHRLEIRGEPSVVTNEGLPVMGLADADAPFGSGRPPQNLDQGVGVKLPRKRRFRHRLQAAEQQRVHCFSCHARRLPGGHGHMAQTAAEISPRDQPKEQANGDSQEREQRLGLDPRDGSNSLVHGHRLSRGLALDGEQGNLGP